MVASRLPPNWWRFPAGPATPATAAATDVFATLKVQCQRLTYWALVESPNTGTTCLLLKPNATTNVTCSNMNVVLAYNVTGSTAYRSPDDNTSAQYRIAIAMTPDITGFTGSLGSGSFKGPNADRPFQSATGNPRWSGYMSLVPTASISASMVVESPDLFGVFFKDRGINSGTFGAFAGALIETPETGTGEADGRLFGIATGGAGGIIGSTFWNAAGGFLGGQNSQGSAHTGVFVVSGGVTQQDTQFQLCSRRIANSQQQNGMFDVISGSVALRVETVWPVDIFTIGAPNRYLGRLRGMFMGNPRVGYGRVASTGVSSSQDLGYFIGTQTSVGGAAGDAVHLYPASGSQGVMPGL